MVKRMCTHLLGLLGPGHCHQALGTNANESTF